MFGVFGSFRSYVLWSITLMCGVIAHSFYHKHYFFRATVYLSHSKFAILAFANLALALVLLFGRILQYIFLGRLRYRERERLQYRIKEAVIETCLAVTVFREDFSARFVTMFTVLLFFKIFHWLANDRVELLEEQPLSPMSAHVRLLGLIVLLLVVDVKLEVLCLQQTYRSEGPTILVLFAFEFMVLVIELLSNFTRYVLNVVENKVYDGNWEGKMMVGFYNELLSEMCQLTVYMGLFLYVQFFYNMPLYIIREMWSTFSKLRKRCKEFLRYRRVLATMDERLQNATEEELEQGDRTCIICREEMTSAKKLPCGHLFCLKCLKGWLGRQETCPTCRTPVDMSSNSRLDDVNERRNERLRRNIAERVGRAAGPDMMQAIREQLLNNLQGNLRFRGGNNGGALPRRGRREMGVGGARPNTLGMRREQAQEAAGQAALRSMAYYQHLVKGLRRGLERHQPDGNNQENTEDRPKNDSASASNSAVTNDGARASANTTTTQGGEQASRNGARGEPGSSVTARNPINAHTPPDGAASQTMSSAERSAAWTESSIRKGLEEVSERRKAQERARDFIRNTQLPDLEIFEEIRALSILIQRLCDHLLEADLEGNARIGELVALRDKLCANVSYQQMRSHVLRTKISQAQDAVEHHLREFMGPPLRDPSADDYFRNGGRFEVNEVQRNVQGPAEGEGAAAREGSNDDGGNRVHPPDCTCHPQNGAGPSVDNQRREALAESETTVQGTEKKYDDTRQTDEKTESAEVEKDVAPAVVAGEDEAARRRRIALEAIARRQRNASNGSNSN